MLDIACGAGALALVAARDGAQILATDFSPGMVAAVLSHGLPNVDALVMDGQALDLPDACFDAAFSIFGIMLFPDWRKGLAEMARVVRPGGSAAWRAGSIPRVPRRTCCWRTAWRRSSPIWSSPRRSRA